MVRMEIGPADMDGIRVVKGPSVVSCNNSTKISSSLKKKGIFLIVKETFAFQK